MIYKQPVERGSVCSEHAVHLFDDGESLGEALASYVVEGIGQGATFIAVVTPAHWQHTRERLEAANLPVDALTASGQLQVWDAGATLANIMMGGTVDRARFDRVVAASVRAVAAEGRPLRVYGELVNLLAAEGDFYSAIALEGLWNDLVEQVPLRLLCGYSSVHFGSPRSAAALRTICSAHSHVRSQSRDLLGTFLLDHIGQVAATNL